MWKEKRLQKGQKISWGIRRSQRKIREKVRNWYQARQINQVSKWKKWTQQENKKWDRGIGHRMRGVQGQLKVKMQENKRTDSVDEGNIIKISNWISLRLLCLNLMRISVLKFTFLSEEVMCLCHYYQKHRFPLMKLYFIIFLIRHLELSVISSLIS